jgi:predicted PurR-regulated permease PerM
MTRDHIPGSWQRVGSILTIVVLVAALYLGKSLFVPFALAALLTFLLAPVVHAIERLRVSRVLAVAVTVLLAFAGIAVLGWVVWTQAGDLARKVDEHKGNLARKIASLQGARETPIAQLQKSVAEATAEPSAGAPPSGERSTAQERPVAPRRAGILEFFGDLFGPLLGPLAAAGVVCVLTIFFLVYLEDLRDRMIRLVSRGQIVVTTQALAEASQRISKYLLMSLVVNALYGIPVGIFLYLLDVPNAALWGLLATLLRFIPYLGPWIAAAFPIALSIAVHPNWSETLKVGGMFVVMELVSNNLIEPWLYGKRTGLSPVAVIVAAVFWTWLWGVVGLLLAVPMTLILAVAGRYVPQLRFLDVLLGDEPGLEPTDRFYQRLVAADSDEAAKVAEAYLKDHPIEDLYDAVVLPALRTAKQDLVEGRLTFDAIRSVRESARDLVTDLAERNGNGHAAPKPPEAKGAGVERVETAAAALEPGPASPERFRGVRVLFLPAGDEMDGIAAQMLADVVRRDGLETKVLEGAALSGEMVDLVKKERPQVVCVVGLLPYAILRARHLCKRLGTEAPDSRIAVVLWDAKADATQVEERMKSSCPQRVSLTFSKAVIAVRALATEAIGGGEEKPRLVAVR